MAKRKARKSSKKKARKTGSRKAARRTTAKRGKRATKGTAKRTGNKLVGRSFKATVHGRKVTCKFDSTTHAVCK